MQNLLTQFFEWAFNQPNHDATLEWYFLGSWWVRCLGNLSFHFFCALIYTIVALLPVIGFAVAGKLEGWSLPDIMRISPFEWAQNHKVQFVIWILFITSSLPFFMWQEARGFEKWVVAPKHANGFSSDLQRKWFETNAKFVDSFWKTVGGLLLSAGILGLAKGTEKEPTPSKEIVAVGKAASDLSAAAESLEHAVRVIASLTKDVAELKALQQRPESKVEEPAPVGSADAVIAPPDGTHV